MSGNNLDSEAIFIRGSASSNGITTLLVGAIVATFGTIIITALPKLFFLVGILFLSGSIIAFVMGFYKLREPKYTLEISKEAIIYHHRKGKWRILWSNIQRIDVPRVHKGLEHIDLEMVGFKLKNPETFLDNISLRLITHLLMEQKPLVTQIAMSDCASGQCYGDDIIDDVKYKLENGDMITGISAMFANRMRKLQKGIGYDVYLSVNDLDRDCADFVALLRECQDSLSPGEINPSAA
jgi:hypothetical protein